MRELTKCPVNLQTLLANLVAGEFRPMTEAQAKWHRVEYSGYIWAPEDKDFMVILEHVPTGFSFTVCPKVGNQRWTFEVLLPT